MKRPVIVAKKTDQPAERQPRGTGARHHGAIAHKLGVAILSGDYGPGHVLGAEVIAAELLGVSRTAYREAVQVLTAKGLVESRPKTGTRVLPRERWNLLDPDVLGWAFAGEPDIELFGPCSNFGRLSNPQQPRWPQRGALVQT